MECHRGVIFCLIMLLNLICISLQQRVVFVDQDNGTNAEECLQANSTDPCRSLDYVSSKITGSDISIKILSNQLHLSEVVSFSHSASLSIMSLEEMVVITRNDSSEKESCGLEFYNITNLTLAGMSIDYCYHESKSFEGRNMAVNISNVTGLSISNVQISHTYGTGLAISDTRGSIIIEKSNFSHNHYNVSSASEMFAGGIHIEFDDIDGSTSLCICHSTFSHNIQPKNVHIEPQKVLNGHSTGGGMCILFKNNVQEVSVNIDHCIFYKNKAHLGAGMHIHFQSDAINNSVEIINSRFEDNFASTGGGLSLGFGKTYNHIYVQHSQFYNNTARYGGGTRIFGTNINVHTCENMLLFENCTWESNHAHYSAAVDIAPFLYRYELCLMPVFSNCCFRENKLVKGHNGNTTYRNSGVFNVGNAAVKFSGTNVFNHNKYTALQVISGKVSLEDGTVMIFENNKGTDGGAVALYGLSSLDVMTNCMLSFQNNTATRAGGGIYYQPRDQKEYIDGRSCFIRYSGERTINNTSQRNITFRFSRNRATLGGSSIFAASFYSCFFSHFNHLRNHNLTDFFEEIGKFHFDEDYDNATISLPLATEGYQFVLNGEYNKLSLPGEVVKIPLTVRDELGHELNTPIGLDIKPRRISNSSYLYFTNQHVRIHANELEQVKLTFNTQNSRNAYFDVTIEMAKCPPGYYFDKISFLCLCSAYNPDTAYIGIPKCNASKLQAYVQRQLWVGYVKDELYTGPCLFGACVVDRKPEPLHLLPQNETELNRVMCGELKNGILCGSCNHNNSAYFHSNTNKCGPNSRCHLGLLFYTLSELIPITLLFSLIVGFNINLNNGGMNGFLFFSQMVGIMSLDFDRVFANRSRTANAFKILQEGHILLYNVFNFDFFSIDQFSFCLWDSAKVMDVLAFKYVTTLFALALIFILIRIMNSKWYMKRNNRTEPKSAVHGVSAFLILSYSQCAFVTFKILDHTKISSNKNATVKYIPVTQHGGLEYLGHDHVSYASAAIIFSCTFIIIPPLLLLAYPLVLQLLSLCNLSEHRFTKRILRALEIHRLTPLFDSFQSCYKNNFRFFAGLYFAYKISLLAIQSYTDYTINLFASSEFVIIAILGIHSLVQPYKKKWHNAVDTCVFLNLAIINGLSIYINQVTSSQDNIVFSPHIVPINLVRMVLVYMPIVVFSIGCIYVLVKKRRRSEYQQLEDIQGISCDDVMRSGEDDINN